MKKYLFATICIFISTITFSQSNLRKYEDTRGRILKDSTEIKHFLQKRKSELEFNQNFNKFSTQAQTSYHLCKNGGFEEYQISGNNTNLIGFQYTITSPLNPTQCQTVSTVSNTDITQYNPNLPEFMSTSVPGNYVDEFIGNINGFDQYVLKINHKNSLNTSSVVQGKRFKTNNETQLVFNYKAVLQSINEPGHENEQPFFKARIIKNDGTIVSEFCLIGDPNNCIFTQAPNLEAGSIVLYNANWQSGILDISGIDNNEDFTVEFIASRCGLSGHFGYVYIDDICLLHTNENSQGSIELNPLYKVCPVLPIQVCGNFTIPNSGGISATVDSITLNILNQTNGIVYTSTSPTINTNNNTFCFTITAANLPNVTNANYNVSASIAFNIVATDCDGTSFNSATDDDANAGWDISFLNCDAPCDLEITPGVLNICDTNNDGKEFFNLPSANSQFISNVTGITFSYHLNYSDAFANINPIATPNAYESYTNFIFVRLTKDATCFKIITLQLNVRNPQATISGILNICSGSTVLTASSGNSYLWSNGATTQSTTVNTVGSHSVTVIDNFGCSSLATVNILPNQVAVLPNLTVVQPGCNSTNGSITVTSAASEFSFDGGITWTTNPQATNLPVGLYKVRIRTAAGCESYDSPINIVPFFNAFPNFDSEQPINCGDSGSITITSLANEYSFDDGVTWTTSNVLQNAMPGDYFIRTKDAQGCISNQNLVTIYADFLNQPEYIFNNPYCGNLGSIIFTTVASEYSINGGATWQSSNEFLNLDQGSYVLRVKNNIGCTSPNDYVYLNNFEDTYTSYVIDNAGCNKYATLTITTYGEEYSFDGGLTWTNNPTLTNLNGPLTFNLIVKKGSCYSIQSTAYVNTSFLPLPIVNDYSELVCDDLNNGSEVVDLTQYKNLLTANSSNLNFSFFTSFNGADSNLFSENISNFTSYNLTNLVTNIYVRISDSNSCYSIAKIELTLIPSPVIDIKSLYYLCENKTVTVTCNSIHDGYSWSTGETTSEIIIDQPGIYTLTTTENHGLIVCSSSKTFDIVLSNPATFSTIQTDDWTDTENIIIVNVTGKGAYEYSLDGINYQNSNQFTGLNSGSYNVFVRDKHGCGLVHEDVFLLNYPKYFTPNNDGINDYWRIKFSQYEPNLTITIFDRYGKEIKSLNSNSLGWDGTYNGSMLISDDYWFVVKRADGREHRGHFTLKR